MEIRFSETWAATFAYPEDTIRRIAQNHNVHARVKWAEKASARFTLVNGWDSYKPATEADHDRVIASLLDLDPDATIRTARAVYEGRDDFNTQRQARLTAAKA